MCVCVDFLWDSWFARPVSFKWVEFGLRREEWKSGKGEMLTFWLEFLLLMKINYSMRLNSLGSAATQISCSWPAKMFASTLASTGHATGLLTGKSWWTRGIPPKMMEEIWISIFAWIIPWNQQIEQYPIVSTTVFTILSIFTQYVHKTDSFC